MQIIKKSREFTKREIYNLTHSPKSKKLSECEDEIQVSGFVVYADDEDEGNRTEITSILAEDGTVYATNSQTAKKELLFIHDLMAGEPYSIEVVKGQSKNGRTYVTVTLAGSDE